MAELKLTDFDHVQRNYQIDYAFRRFAIMSDGCDRIPLHLLDCAFDTLYRSDQIFMVLKPIRFLVSEERSPVSYDTFKRHVNDLEVYVKWVQIMMHVAYQQKDLQLQIGFY